MEEKELDEMVERLLDEPYWVIDMLPQQVQQGGAGQFFAVERYYLDGEPFERLLQRFVDVLLGLNCYHDLRVLCGDEWVLNPEPATLVGWLAEALRRGHLCVLVDDDCLITASGGDTNLTLYRPSPAVLELAQQLATAAGLYVWQPIDK